MGGDVKAAVEANTGCLWIASTADMLSCLPYAESPVP